MWLSRLVLLEVVHIIVKRITSMAAFSTNCRGIGDTNLDKPAQASDDSLCVYVGHRARMAHSLHARRQSSEVHVTTTRRQLEVPM